MQISVSQNAQQVLGRYVAFRTRLIGALQAQLFADSCAVDASSPDANEIVLKCGERDSVTVTAAQLASPDSVEGIVREIATAVATKASSRTFSQMMVGDEFFTLTWRLFTLLIVLLASFAVGLMIYKGGITTADVANSQFIRGLVTIIFLVGTLLFVIVLILNVLFANDETSTLKRVALAREIVTPIFGILGTIVGFYFGSATQTGQPGTTAANARVQALGGVLRGNTLLLDHTKVQDADLIELTKELPNLDGISLDGTDITDTGVTALQNLKRLRWVSLHDTKKISQPSIEELKQKGPRGLQVYETPPSTAPAQPTNTPQIEPTGKKGNP